MSLDERVSRCPICFHTGSLIHILTVIFYGLCWVWRVLFPDSLFIPHPFSSCFRLSFSGFTFVKEAKSHPVLKPNSIVWSTHLLIGDLEFLIHRTAIFHLLLISSYIFSVYTVEIHRNTIVFAVGHSDLLFCEEGAKESKITKVRKGEEVYIFYDTGDFIPLFPSIHHLPCPKVWNMWGIVTLVHIPSSTTSHPDLVFLLYHYCCYLSPSSPVVTEMRAKKTSPFLAALFPFWRDTKATKYSPPSTSYPMFCRCFFSLLRCCH